MVSVARKIFGGVSIASAVALAIPADAQTTAYAPGQGSPNEINLSIPVTASVGGRCGFADSGAPSGTYHQPDFDVNGLLNDFAFELECTGPSRVAVISTNGGLMAAGTATTGYTLLAPYEVTLNLVGDTQTANATCDVDTLTSGSTCSFVGPASTAQGLRLDSPSIDQTGSYLRVSAPAYAGMDTLVAGTYADTLTVTVSAAP